jgi:hypothetical protein
MVLKRFSIGMFVLILLFILATHSAQFTHKVALQRL